MSETPVTAGVPVAPGETSKAGPERFESWGLWHIPEVRPLTKVTEESVLAEH